MGGNDELTSRCGHFLEQREERQLSQRGQRDLGFVQQIQPIGNHPGLKQLEETLAVGLGVEPVPIPLLDIADGSGVRALGQSLRQLRSSGVFLINEFDWGGGLGPFP